MKQVTRFVTNVLTCLMFVVHGLPIAIGGVPVEDCGRVLNFCFSTKFLVLTISCSTWNVSKIVYGNSGSLPDL